MLYFLFVRLFINFIALHNAYFVFRRFFFIFSSLNLVVRLMDASSDVLKVIPSRLAGILTIKALKLLYMQPSLHYVMVFKRCLFSYMFNRKHTASVSFVLFINTYFTCQIIRIVAACLKTCQGFFFHQLFFFVVLQQLYELLTEFLACCV